MSRYCHIHGEYKEYEDGCPKCQEAEERREEREREAEERDKERAREAEERAEDIIYKRANPGDYECPACKYTTLRRDASRCPMCHATIEDRYWEDVERAEAEWKRTEPERLAAAAKRAEAAAKRRFQETFNSPNVFGVVVIIIAIIVIIYLSASQSTTP